MGENGEPDPVKVVHPKTHKWFKNAGIGLEKRRRSSLATNYRIENNKVIIENEDGTVQELEIVASKEKHGKLRKAVPSLPVPLAVICLILNLFPGLGTFFSGFGALCGYKSELDSKTATLCWNVVTALLQLILAPIIVGWIWSLHRGVLLVQESMNRKIAEREQKQQDECPA